MKPDDILIALKSLTDRECVEFLPLAPDSRPLSPYAPIQKYALDLKNVAKPETAAEDLFTALCKDVLGFQPTRQVGSGEGWVDFMLPERMGEPLPLELKPLFQYDKKADSVWRNEANPKNHVNQVKKYLREHEYLILTDLRTAWFFSARDFFFDEKPFAEMPFTEFFSRCRESRSVLDTLRRAEDTADKPELEQQFFDDLNIWFNEFDKIKWTPPDQAAESIILLINKLVFARTIEDFGLVPYRYTQDAYARHTRDWQAKGAHRIVPKFLDQFEEFFDEYYDTEIFSARVWQRLDKDPANLQCFCDKLNFVLGINAWDQVFSRGIVHYNYRRIDEDIFGKSYEMFLAANRKGEGIYYTPAPVTGPMANALVNSLAGKIVDEICDAVGSQKCDFARADKLIAQLAEIRVADTACGSGGFLIKVLRAFWQQYQRIDSACAWVAKILKPDNGELYLAELPPNVENALAFRRRNNLDNRRVLIAQILLRHIFGVDKDPGAIEVAKTNIWKEAVKLSPADYNYRELKTDVVKILPNLELNFYCADSLVDVELEKQAQWLAEYHRAELKKLAELRALYIKNPMLHEALDEALALRKKVRANFVEHFAGENLPCEPGGFALHFWPCWFNADGTAKSFIGRSRGDEAQISSPPKPSANKSQSLLTSAPTDETNGGRAPAPGFDGIIGNPPWEGFKPIAKEFVARLKENFSKYTMAGTDFTPWFDKKLKAEPDFRAKWDEYVSSYEKSSEFFSRRFKFQGGGDINLYKLFIEGDLNLVRDGGRLSLLVPSGLQTDEGCGPLRKLLLTENKFEELTSFENRGYEEIVNGKERTKHIFPDVDSRFKFGFFKVVKGETPANKHTFDARFYLHDPKDIFAPPIRYSVEMIRRFSPENFGIMEFRSGRDYELCAKIRGGHPLLQSLGFRLSTELHMTNDNHFFRNLNGKKPAAGQLPLYEGKMIHQFDADYSPGNYAVVEKEIREELLRKEIYRLAKLVREVEPKKLEGKAVPEKREELETHLREIFKTKKFKLQYEYERLAYREIGSSTNERTCIAALIPKDACLNHKLIFFVPFEYELDAKGSLKQVEFADEDMNSVLSLLNSLIVNYYLRSRVSTSVSMFYIYELPVPKLSTLQKKKLADFAGKLLKNPRDVKERAALETFIARELYGLSLDDWKHLTGTFTFGGGESKAELDEIIRQSLALWAK